MPVIQAQSIESANDNFSEYEKAHSACQLRNVIYEQFMQYD